VLFGLLAAVWLVVPIAISTCQEDVQVAADPPLVASDDEQRAILHVLIETINFDGEPPPPPSPGEEREVRAKVRKPVVLLDKSIALCAGAARGDGECSTEIDESSLSLVDSRIPKQMVREHLVGSINRYSTPKPELVGVVMEAPKHIEEILAGEGGWGRFHQMYPLSAGTVSTTRAVLSQDRMQALIYVAHGCGQLCGTGSLYYMSRANGSWKIEHRFQLRAS